jgi:hypothetical protein
MDASIPAALQGLSSAGAAMKEFSAWRMKARGAARALIGELQDNLHYLDMVAEDNVPLGDVIDKLSASEYKKLAQQGFNFNSIKKRRIESDPSLIDSDLSSWPGKETEALIESIYDKINEIRIKFPHLANNEKYRWSVRVNNIRKRIWLLLKHVRA